MSDDFEVTHGHYEERHAGLAWRIVDAWRDMSGSTHRLIREDPPEGRLLFYVLMADIVVFLSWALKTVVVPHPDAPIPLQVSLVLVLALMLRTTAMYVFAGVAGFIVGLFGGTGSYRDVRAGVFWGALVAAPFSLLAALISVSLAATGSGGEQFILPLYWISMIPFVWYISAGLAEARNVRVAPVFLGLTLATCGALFLALYASAVGWISPPTGMH